MLGVASVLEVAAYYIPVIDHLLDTIASPAAVVAGTVAAGAMLPFATEMHPAVKWAAALVAGGGAAGVVQAGTVSARAVSGATTGTLGNPIVATVENVFSDRAVDPRDRRADHRGAGRGARVRVGARMIGRRRGRRDAST